MINLKRSAGWRFCLAALACWLCFSGGVAQATSPFFWDDIDVDITLETDGDLLVTETQKYVFTANHTPERYRYIPLKGIGSITDVAVYENNEPLTISTGTRNDNYWIGWQHALTPPAAHTFVLSYRVVGGVQVKGNRSQIYWNALFPERSAAINRGKVTVHVPDALAGKVTVFQGEGVASRDRKLNPTTFEFVPNGALEPQQFLNIRLGFPTNALAITQPYSDQWVRQKSPLDPVLRWVPFGSIILVIVGAITTLRKRCPNCGQLALHRSSRVVRKATRYSHGQKDVQHTCQRCNYDRTFTQRIPRKSSSTSSGASVWGGYDGGGSSGGDSGGGGGGCGGGGCGGGGCGGGG